MQDKLAVFTYFETLIQKIELMIGTYMCVIQLVFNLGAFQAFVLFIAEFSYH